MNPDLRGSFVSSQVYPEDGYAFLVGDVGNSLCDKNQCECDQLVYYRVRNQIYVLSKAIGRINQTISKCNKKRPM